jgi:hypothetical protein
VVEYHFGVILDYYVDLSKQGEITFSRLHHFYLNQIKAHDFEIFIEYVDQSKYLTFCERFIEFENFAQTLQAKHRP